MTTSGSVCLHQTIFSDILRVYLQGIHFIAEYFDVLLKSSEFIDHFLYPDHFVYLPSLSEMTDQTNQEARTPFS